MLLRAALLFLCAAPAALAGPWPDEPSGTFISVTEDFAEGTGEGTTSIFVESAGSESFTIGIDSVLGETDDDWSALAFIRQPLTPTTARDRLAVSAGFGAQATTEGTEPLVLLGGAWGRDVDGNVGGWLSLEGEARYGPNTGDTELQGDATLAVEPVDRIALVNELSVTGVPGSEIDAETQLTTSIVGSISERARLELGATVDLTGDAPTGIRLGTWLEF
ncbi:MAG: hypothetical protein QNJ13_02265 [Paracoccaceae bacterium]|nr:hypothetical protein [Paracoccaceae bacterium]